MLWLPAVLALLELDGRLVEALPVRPVVLAEGRSLVVGLLTLPLALGRDEPPLTVGRLELLPFTLLLETEALLPPDMLPLTEALLPPFTLWLIEPVVLPLRTVAT